MNFYEFHTLIENQLYLGNENIETIGYHVSKSIFDFFDDSKLGSNTYQSQANKIFSIDSFLGHQFFPDPETLYQHLL